MSLLPSKKGMNIDMISNQIKELKGKISELDATALRALIYITNAPYTEKIYGDITRIYIDYEVFKSKVLYNIPKIRRDDYVHETLEALMDFDFFFPVDENSDSDDLDNWIYLLLDFNLIKGAKGERLIEIMINPHLLTAMSLMCHNVTKELDNVCKLKGKYTLKVLLLILSHEMYHNNDTLLIEIDEFRELADIDYKVHDIRRRVLDKCEKELANLHMFEEISSEWVVDKGVVTHIKFNIKKAKYKQQPLFKETSYHTNSVASTKENVDDGYEGYLKEYKHKKTELDDNIKLHKIHGYIGDKEINLTIISESDNINISLNIGTEDKA